MSPEDIKTMKLSRTDLVKVCAAELLAEVRQAKVDAIRSVGMVRVAFDSACEHEARELFEDVVEFAARSCNGREGRIEWKVCCDILPSEDVPEFAAVIVTDGTSYDNNFRLQFHVGIEGGLRTHAIDVQKAIEYQIKIDAQSERQSAMDTKAREKLIREALDTLPEGREALASLAAMRKKIKL